MAIDTRKAFVAFLGLAALGALAARSTLGQADGQVRKADAAQQTGAAAPRIGPAVVASINLERIIQEYDKYKESSESFQADALKKQQELTSLMNEAKTAAEKRDSVKPGTPDYQKWNDQFTDLMARYNAEKEKVTNDFMLKESNAIAEIYNDVRYITKWYAEQKGISLVVQVGKDENLSGDDPNTVMAAMARNVVYYHSQTDITEPILTTLNAYYQRQKAQSSPAAAPSGDGE